MSSSMIDIDEPENTEAAVPKTATQTTPKKTFTVKLPPYPTTPHENKVVRRR